MFPIQWLLLIVFAPLPMGLTNTSQKNFNKIINPEVGPMDMHQIESTSCQTFAKNARFNPDSVVGETWFVFYYWAPKKPTPLYQFRIPSKHDMKYLHSLFDGHLPANFNWSTSLVFIKNLANNRTKLLVERTDRGQYWKFPIYKDIPEGEIIQYTDIRIKQTADNKYLGIMDCKRQTTYIMSRLNEVPSQMKLQGEAAKLGFHGRRGKSYLYRGHEWMPIPEADEDDYWMRNNKFKRRFNLD